MKAAYGAIVVRVKEDQQGELLGQISHLLKKPEIEAPLQEVADYFDECGDYESPLQHKFLEDYGRSKKPDASQIDKVAEGANLLWSRVLADFSNKSIDWVVAARLERHRRHHLWLYWKERGKQMRRSLWQTLAYALKFYEFSNLDERLRFDFLVGLHEIEGAKKTSDWERYNDTLSGSYIFQRRMQMAADRKIWRISNIGTAKQQLESLNKNAEKLLDYGWEACPSGKPV